METWKEGKHHLRVSIEDLYLITGKGAENLCMWPDEEITWSRKQRIW